MDSQLLIKNLPAAVDATNPWARDKLERKAVADYLTPVLASIRQPFVVSLHSPYGTGKSFFLDCWKHDLEQKGFRTVLFNAWETDFTHDALFAVMASLKRELAGKDKAAAKQFSELVKKTAGMLRSKGGALLLKGLASKLLSEEGTKELLEGLSVSSEEAASLFSNVAMQALEAQEAAENSMTDFTKFLAKIVKDITEQQTKKTDYPHTNDPVFKKLEDDDFKKLIIFVDELDRCRPNYAIEVLECIKHLFAVEGVVFVLAIDDEQMKSAIASTYGPRLDGDGYLRKFIDWQFQLPEPPIRTFCQFLAETMLPSSINRSDTTQRFHELIDGVAIVADAYQMSLREVEQSLSCLNLVLRSTYRELDMNSIALGLAAALFTKKVKNLDMLSKDLLEADRFLEHLSENLSDQALKRDYERIFQDKRMLSLFLSEQYAEVLKTKMNDEFEGKSEAEQRSFALYKDHIVPNFQQGFASRDYYKSVFQISLEHVTGAVAYLRR